MSLNGTAVSVSGISKRYNLATARGAGRLVDRVGQMMRQRDRIPRPSDDMWALRDVTFTVPPGRVVAVLGRNGSGKTTLMKILARVTAPTEGRATIHGRVGAIFQVGTGFHPELSGRENVMLSGALLGVEDERMREIYDQIIDFAAIGDFIETPVKFYSSGMYLRLAFAVTTNIDADILLIDEALSVGDEAFHAKSNAKIHEMVGSGRTVIYASHSRDSVEELCDSALVLEQGRLVFEGRPGEAFDLYMKLNAERRMVTRPK